MDFGCTRAGRIGLVLLAMTVAQRCSGAAAQAPEKDMKGALFFILTGAPELASALGALAGEGGQLEIVTVAAGDRAARAGTIAARDAAEIGGVLEIVAGAGGTEEAGGAEIEVYHYAFPPLAAERIASPEYTFKFASDSALLAICLHGAFPDAAIAPAAEGVAGLPHELLRKSARLRLPVAATASPAAAREVAARVCQALERFRTDAGHAVMGLVSEKALRHAPVSDIEVRIERQIYPAQKASGGTGETRPAAASGFTVRPLPSGIFFASGLERLAPYSYTLVNRAAAPDALWRELDRGAFLTSSVGGIVRTAPNRRAEYRPPSGAGPAAAPAAERANAATGEPFDYVIADAVVFDGTRDGRRVVADVAIAGDRIAATGDLDGMPRQVTIDGRGLFLMPGFIDIHSHADNDVLEAPDAASHIRQGITTVLGGNCSFSPLGIAAFLGAVERAAAAVNIGILIGNRPVRERVLGDATGAPDYDAIYRQKELVDLAMEEGAFGLSSGLIYSISEEAYTLELAELAKQCKPYGGFYASHIRGETDEVLDAARECIFIAELAEVPAQISHMKAINRRNWGDMGRYIGIMEAARARGLDVTGDQYPWRASGPAAHYSLHRLLVRDAIEAETPEVVLLKEMPAPYARYSGRPLPELLAAEGLTAEELLLALKLEPDTPVYATYLCLGEEDLRRAMASDFVMVCTDASLVGAARLGRAALRDEHPRKFRTYPEFFARYVRDGAVCSWELGVYKCTGLPASRMKLADRGAIRPGARADLVLLDPAALDPGADYRDQRPPPRGILWVFVNGAPALRDGALTGARAGRALRAYGHGKP